jgi:hypothetical protein
MGNILTLADVVRSLSLRRERRTFANVFFKSVLKLGVYRKLGSRIDFIGHRGVLAGYGDHRPGRGKVLYGGAHTRGSRYGTTALRDHLH